MATTFYVNHLFETNANAEPAAVGTVDNIPYHCYATSIKDHNLAAGTGLQVEAIQFFVRAHENFDADGAGDDGTTLANSLHRFGWGAEAGGSQTKLQLRNAAMTSTEMKDAYERALATFIQSAVGGTDALQSTAGAALAIGDLIDDYTKWTDATNSADGQTIVNGGDGATASGADPSGYEDGGIGNITQRTDLTNQITPEIMERMVDVLASQQRTNQYKVDGNEEDAAVSGANLKLRLRTGDTVSFTVRVEVRATASTGSTTASPNSDTSTAAAANSNGEGAVFGQLLRAKSFSYHSLYTGSVGNAPSGAFDMRMNFTQAAP